MNNDCWFGIFYYLKDSFIIGCIGVINNEFHELSLEFINKKYKIEFQHNSKLLCKKFSTTKALSETLVKDLMLEWEEIGQTQQKIQFVQKIHQNSFIKKPSHMVNGLYHLSQRGLLPDKILSKLCSKFDRKLFNSENIMRTDLMKIFPNKLQYKKLDHLIEDILMIYDRAPFGQYCKVPFLMFSDIEEIETKCEKFGALCSLVFSSATPESLYMPSFWNIYASTDLSDLVDLFWFIERHPTPFQSMRMNLFDQSLLWYYEMFFHFTKHPDWTKIKSNVNIIPSDIFCDLTLEKHTIIYRHYLVQLHFFDENKWELLKDLSVKSKITLMLADGITFNYKYHLPIGILKESKMRLYFDFVVPLIKEEFNFCICYEFVSIFRTLTKDQIKERCLIIKEFGKFLANKISYLLTLLPIELYQRLILHQRHNVPIKSEINFSLFNSIPKTVLNELSTIDKKGLYSQLSGWYSQLYGLNETQRRKFFYLFDIIHPRPHIEILVYLAKNAEIAKIAEIDTFVGTKEFPLKQLSLLEFLESISTKTDASLKQICTIFQPVNVDIIKTWLLIQQSQIGNSIIYQLILKQHLSLKTINRFLRRNPNSQISEQHIAYYLSIKTELSGDFLNASYSSDSKILDLLTLDLSQLIAVYNDLFKPETNLYKIVHTHLNTHDFYRQSLIESILFYSEEERRIVLEYFVAMNDVNEHIKLLIGSECDFQRLNHFPIHYLARFFNFIKILADNDISNKTIKMIQILQTLESPKIFSFLDIHFPDKDAILQCLYRLLMAELSNRLTDFYLNLNINKH